MGTEIEKIVQRGCLFCSMLGYFLETEMRSWIKVEVVYFFFSSWSSLLTTTPFSIVCFSVTPGPNGDFTVLVSCWGVVAGVAGVAGVVLGSCFGVLSAMNIPKAPRPSIALVTIPKFGVPVSLLTPSMKVGFVPCSPVDRWTAGWRSALSRIGMSERILACRLLAVNGHFEPKFAH